MTIPKLPPRIAAVGSAGWDEFIVVDRFPAIGDYRIVREVASMPGGTTSNSAVTLARLKADISIAAKIGDDRAGRSLRSKLFDEGVNVDWLSTCQRSDTDFNYIVVSNDPPSRTMFWRVGARIGDNDEVDMRSIYGHKVIILDVNDFALRRRIGSSDERSSSGTTVVGTITYLVGDNASSGDGLHLALNDDIIVGNEEQYLQLTSTSVEKNAVNILQRSMETSRLSAFVITRGGRGSTVFTKSHRFDFPPWPINAVDTTGAGDAFAGALAFGVACEWEWTKIGPFANAVGALATRGLGAQATLPTIEEVVSFMSHEL